MSVGGLNQLDPAPPAGRHEKVPSEVLGEVTHLLKYSYGVYYLQPKIEHPGSCIDVLCWKPPNPTDVRERLGGRPAVLLPGQASGG